MLPYLEGDIVRIADRIELDLLKANGSNVLITGASGFLGKYFMATFAEFNRRHPEKPFKIVAIDNHVTSPEVVIPSRDLGPNVEWIYADAKVASELPDTFHYIIHAAGIASPQHYRAKPLETIEVTVGVTDRLLERAKKDAARLLFFSSSEIYGDPTPDAIPTNETYNGNVSCRGPRACYDESKRLGETLCWVYSEHFGVHASVVRPFNVYGPGMLATDYRVLPNFAWALASNKPINIYGSGQQTRTYCYVTDAIFGFLLVLFKGKKADVYNVGNPNPEISVNQLAEYVAKAANVNLSLVHTDYPDSYPSDEPLRRCPDITKIENELGYAPEVGIEKGLVNFLMWAKSYYIK